MFYLFCLFSEGHVLFGVSFCKRNLQNTTIFGGGLKKRRHRRSGMKQAPPAAGLASAWPRARPRASQSRGLHSNEKTKKNGRLVLRFYASAPKTFLLWGSPRGWAPSKLTSSQSTKSALAKPLGLVSLGCAGEPGHGASAAPAAHLLSWPKPSHAAGQQLSFCPPRNHCTPSQLFRFVWNRLTK